MFQPPRLLAGGRALLRALLAAALVFTAFVPSEAEAQRGPALQLRSLELVELGQARHGRGDIRRWGLHYRQGRRVQHGAQLEVTLERGATRRLVRHVALTGRRGTVPIGPARGQARVHVRAFDRHGQPMAIRVGRGPRLPTLAMITPVHDRWRADRRPVEPVTRVDHRSRWQRTQVTVNGRARVASGRRTEPRRVDGPTTRGWQRHRPAPGQLSGADRACRNAFTGDANEMRCLQLVRSHPRPAAQVAACEDAFTGDEAELRCLEVGADPRHVHACEDMLTGDAAELQCLQTVGSSRAHPAMVDEVLRVCDERVGDAAELACVVDLLAPGRRAKR